MLATGSTGTQYKDSTVVLTLLVYVVLASSTE
jgi:hypothetical protein